MIPNFFILQKISISFRNLSIFVSCFLSISIKLSLNFLMFSSIPLSCESILSSWSLIFFSIHFDMLGFHLQQNKIVKFQILRWPSMLFSSLIFEKMSIYYTYIRDIMVKTQITIFKMVVLLCYVLKFYNSVLFNVENKRIIRRIRFISMKNNKFNRIYNILTYTVCTKTFHQYFFQR